jgi:transcriptional regulator with GAF, ATPase, and Fis domain
MSERAGVLGTKTDLRAFTLTMPSVRVTVTRQGADPQDYPLGIAPLVVGSGEDCDIVVPDQRVSRRHCRISLASSGVVVRDLGSKNGTYIMGVEVLEGVLLAGSTARIGSSTISLRTVDAPTVIPLSPEVSFGGAVGASVVMRALFALLDRAARTSETVVLLGESGTGKEILARAIHDKSPRSEGPFVVLDCSAVAANLVEAELFGNEVGAFTGAERARPGLFEQAHRGTLFLDEIGELPIDLQPKLMRALESRRTRRLGASEWKSFDTRIVAATHRDLRARVTAGSFREDLYYRLAVVEAHVPPLRDRREDIPLLVERFLGSMAPPVGLDALPPSALALFASHDWPGNVRELRNMVSRVVLFPHLIEDIAPAAPPSTDSAARSSQEPLSASLSAAAPSSGSTPSASPSLVSLFESPLREAREIVVAEFERKYLVHRLRHAGGNIARAARAMGVSRQFAHRLVVQHGIKPEDDEAT